MKPDQPCKKQVCPPFSGEELAQSCFLSSSFPLSHFVSLCLCWTWFLMSQIYTCVYISGPGFIPLSTFYGVHTQWFYRHCGCFLAHFPSLSFCIHFFSLLVHPYILIFNFSFAETLFSSWLLHSSFCCCLKLSFLRVTGFSLTQWPQKVNTVAACVLSFSSTLCYYFWSANGVDVFPIMCHWHTLHNLFRFSQHGQGGIVVRRNKALNNWECRQEGRLHTWGE